MINPNLIRIQKKNPAERRTWNRTKIGSRDWTQKKKMMMNSMNNNRLPERYNVTKRE
jgi:hypothetical protein